MLLIFDLHRKDLIKKISGNRMLFIDVHSNKRYLLINFLLQGLLPTNSAAGRSRDADKIQTHVLQPA